MNNIPDWVLWLWGSLITISSVIGLISTYRSGDSRKRTNARLEKIDTQLDGFTEMKGKVDATRDDVAIIKRILMGDKK